MGNVDGALTKLDQMGMLLRKSSAPASRTSLITALSRHAVWTRSCVVLCGACGLHASHPFVRAVGDGRRYWTSAVGTVKLSRCSVKRWMSRDLR